MNAWTDEQIQEKLKGLSPREARRFINGRIREMEAEKRRLEREVEDLVRRQEEIQLEIGAYDAASGGHHRRSGV